MQAQKFLEEKKKKNREKQRRWRNRLSKKKKEEILARHRIYDAKKRAALMPEKKTIIAIQQKRYRELRKADPAFLERRKEESRAYYRKPGVKKRISEASKRRRENGYKQPGWKTKTPEQKAKCIARKKVWRENNKKKLRIYARRWVLKNKNKWREIHKIYQRKMRKELTLYYIRRVLKRREMETDAVSDFVIDYTRLTILLWREINAKGKSPFKDA